MKRTQATVLSVVLALAMLMVMVGSSQATGTCPGPSAYCWKQVTSPNASTGDNVLKGVATADKDLAWAVGYYRNTTTSKDNTLIEKWNGTSWSTMTSPNQGSNHNYLNAVAVPNSLVGGYDVWAVGNYLNSSGTSQTLIEKLAGGTGSWSIVSSPNQGSNNNRLTGVAGAKSTDMWAVGYYGDGTTTGARPVTLHYTSTTTGWQIALPPIPSNPGGSFNVYLTSVTAYSTNSAWAAGYYESASYIYPYVIEWNGSTWTDRSPTGGSGFEPSLDGIAFNASSHGLTIGGDYAGAGANGYERLTNNTWNPNTPTTNPGPLKGIAFVSGTEAWATGYRTVGSSILSQTQYWDGSGWTYYQAVDPSGSTDVRFNAVDGIATTDTWGVGYYNDGTRKATLIEHFTN